MSNPFSLEGKLIIVTGASSGIGRQCAISCSKMGASVALLGRDSNRLSETLSGMVNPGSHVIHSIDLLDYKGVSEFIEELVNTKGRINGLINCAGISTTIPLNGISIDKLEHFLNTNVISAINITKHVVKSTHFCEQGGSIIFISSVMGITGEAGKTLYSLTKGAVVAAVKSLSIELALKRIRVNTISPGVVETPMSKQSVYNSSEESLNRIKLMHPLGLGYPEDVANACIFLLSDAARWITGTNLIVDGGYTAR